MICIQSNKLPVSFQILLFKKALVFTFVGMFFPQLRVNELEKSLINISATIEESFNDTLNVLQAVQSEINGLSPVVLQNRIVLDALTAQQGGARARIGKKCCFYVDKSGIVVQNVKDLKYLIKIFHQISDTSSTDLFHC